jgi:quercetin dioxygenase-like cupin family protein/DNA-binding XRE family transcriptional regulator
VRLKAVPSTVDDGNVDERVPDHGPNESADFQMEGDAIEAFIKDKRIGLRIRALRQKNSMGLVDLGLHVGLSASFLSQLETGRVVPTLRNLARIAMVFSKDLSYFFDPGPRTLFKVHRKAERVRLPQSGVEDPMYFFESLGYLVPDRQLDPYLAEFQPLAGRSSRPHQHAGCEFLYVLKGRLSIEHGDTFYELESGDSVYFDSSTTHSYSCLGDEPATVLIVTLQQPSQSFKGARPGETKPAVVRHGSGPMTPAPLQTPGRRL